MKTYYLPTTAITQAAPTTPRTYTRLLITALISIVVIALAMGTAYHHAQQPTLADKVQWTVPYSVDSGDTLWAIAQSIPGADGHDTRALVSIIKAHNHIGTDIKVGTTLVLPTTWEVR